MKTVAGKTITPQKFQKQQLEDLEAHRSRIEKRARTFAKKATVVIKNCCLCGSSNIVPFLPVFGFEYLQCRACTHLTLNKRLSKEDLDLFYSLENSYSQTYTNPEQIEYRLNNIAHPKVEFVMKHIGYPKKGTWYDVGSAIGDVPKAVEKYTGWKAIGTEISKDSVAVGKKLLKVDLRRKQLAEFANEQARESFDVVSAFGYLALIPEPLEELKLMHSLLKDGGYIVIGESNADSVSTFLQKSYPQLTNRHLVPPNTLHEFTTQSMITVLKKLHFKPVVAWNFGLDFVELLKYFSLLSPGFQETPIFEFLLSQANEFQKVIDTKQKGDYILMIAQKVK
jgi:SAM-dependent methyltransferase